jgi:Family of unknown function (DUF6104)
MGEGVDRLRRRRGEEEVTFDNVADHLVDFAERHPGEADVIDRLARFLADVEDVDHHHERDPERGLPPPGNPPTE